MRARTTAQGHVRRCRIVLLSGTGLSARAVAETLGVNRRTVALWRERFLAGGCEALLRDRPGRGRKRKGSLVYERGAVNSESETS